MQFANIPNGMLDSLPANMQASQLSQIMAGHEVVIHADENLNYAKYIPVFNQCQRRLHVSYSECRKASPLPISTNLPQD